MRMVSEPHFASVGVSPAQWGVLRSLARLREAGLPEPRMVELGEALLVQPPSLSATLDRMEKAGLIRRTPDPDDLRSRRVELTELGRSVLAAAQPGHTAWVSRLTECLTPSEQTNLRSLLNKLGDHLHALACTSWMTESTGAPAAQPRGRARRSA